MALDQLLHDRLRRREFVENAAKPVDNDRHLREAFKLAAREQDELRRLKASGMPYACLDFVGASGYEALDRSRSETITESAAARSPRDSSNS